MVIKGFLAHYFLTEEKKNQKKTKKGLNFICRAVKNQLMIKR